MTRKVSIEGEAIVNVPVKVKFSMLLRADNDASIDKALKLASQQKQYAKADVEMLDVDEILEVGNYDGTDELDAAVQEALEYGQFKVLKSEVTDSR